MHQNWDKNQPEHVPKLFLDFEKISASCSYKLGSHKKTKRVSLA
jgi:putative ribosome biogenesis GTPase RsgA